MVTSHISNSTSHYSFAFLSLFYLFVPVFFLLHVFTNFDLLTKRTEKRKKKDKRWKKRLCFLLVTFSSIHWTSYFLDFQCYTMVGCWMSNIDANHLWRENVFKCVALHLYEFSSSHHFNINIFHFPTENWMVDPFRRENWIKFVVIRNPF